MFDIHKQSAIRIVCLSAGNKVHRVLAFGSYCFSGSITFDVFGLGLNNREVTAIMVVVGVLICAGNA